MKEYICIAITETGEYRKLEQPVWITKNRNGILRTPHRGHALGVGDGEQIWSLGSLEGYPEARLITLAEYLEAQGESDPDPELTDAQALAIILGGSYETE